MAAATVGAVWLWWQSHRITSSGNDFIRRAWRNLVPGNCVCGGDQREGRSGERSWINPESFFYLASDGEIQINSCQSDGPQGKGLQQWGWLDGWGKDDRERGGLQGQGLTDELSVNPGFFHRFITSFPGLHTLVQWICISFLAFFNYLKASFIYELNMTFITVCFITIRLLG